MVTKAVLKEQWRQEKLIWCPGPRLLVESYDKLARDVATRRAFARFRPDVLIIDEGQRVKNPEARRTIALYGRDCTRTHEGIAHFADKLWVLSGTLTPNHIGEAWTHLRAMGYTQMEYEEFLNYFCVTIETQFGTKVVDLKQNRVPEFLGLLKPYTRRRRFRDVFPHIPTPRWTTLPLELDTTGRKQLADLNRDLAVRRMQKELRAAKTVEEREQILERAQPHTASARNVLAAVKAPMVADIVEDLLESGVPKVVVFAWHHTTLDLLRKRLEKHNVVGVDGRTPEKKRTAAIAAFQTDPTVRVFLGQNTTAGEGVPLHAARVMVLAEYSWSLGEVIQVAQRIVSADVDSQPEIIVPQVKGTVDEAVADVVLKKVEHANVLNQL